MEEVLPGFGCVGSFGPFFQSRRSSTGWFGIFAASPCGSKWRGPCGYIKPRICKPVMLEKASTCCGGGGGAEESDVADGIGANFRLHHLLEAGKKALRPHVRCLTMSRSSSASSTVAS